jgi:hypothetical protein
LKVIIANIRAQEKANTIVIDKQEDENRTPIVDELHPVLKKISNERWYPHDSSPITLDSIIDVILTKLTNASKTMLKTLTKHLVQLHR